MYFQQCINTMCEEVLILFEDAPENFFVSIHNRHLGLFAVFIFTFLRCCRCCCCCFFLSSSLLFCCLALLFFISSTSTHFVLLAFKLLLISFCCCCCCCSLTLASLKIFIAFYSNNKKFSIWLFCFTFSLLVYFGHFFALSFSSSVKMQHLLLLFVLSFHFSHKRFNNC